MSKYVLITGATSGIGLEFSKVYYKHGYNLILVGRNKEKLRELKTNFSKVKVHIFSLDLSILENVDILLKNIKAEKLEVDILINNAGAGFNGEFLEISWEKHNNIIDLNIKSLSKLTYGILEMMKNRGYGKVLNVASTGAYQPGPFIGVYYATKAYVLSFSAALREEVKDYGIIVSCLCPGATKTEFSKRAGKGDLNVAMDARVVAEVGFKGLKKNKAIIIPGTMNKVAIILSKIMPTVINSKVVKKIQKKAIKLKEFK